MSVFILVHGAFHGAWCWQRVVPLLIQAGQGAVALDLPGLGDDPTPIAEATFDRGIARIVAAIDEAAGPVILVGHSMGGVAITQAAEGRPERIAQLVYLTALLPGHGQSAFGLGRGDSGLLPYGMQIAADGASASIRAEWVQPMFLSDCAAEDVAMVQARLRPQPLEPSGHPVSITEARAGSVPRSYIECLRDHAITPGFQRKMYTDRPCRTVLTLDTGHSPFLNAPRELTDHLLGCGAIA